MSVPHDVFVLTPEETEDLLKDIGDRELERLQEGLKRVHDDGYLIFGPSRPATQLWGYMTETFPDEFLLIMDPDYLDKYEDGLVPPVRETAWYLMNNGQKVMRPSPTPGFQLAVFASRDEAVQYGLMLGLITPEMLQPQIQTVVDPISGMPTQQQVEPELPVEERPSFWGVMLSLPKFQSGSKTTGPFAWEAADFRRLWESFGRRVERGQTA